MSFIPTSFKGRLREIDGADLVVVFVDGSQIPARSMTHVDDITAEVEDAEESRATAVGTIVVDGDLVSAAFDADVTIDLDGCEEQVGFWVALDGANDAARELVAWCAGTPGPGTSDFAVETTEGRTFAQVREPSAANTFTVAGVAAVDGDVPASDLADALSVERSVPLVEAPLVILEGNTVGVAYDDATMGVNEAGELEVIGGGSGGVTQAPMLGLHCMVDFRKLPNGPLPDESNGDGLSDPVPLIDPNTPAPGFNQAATIEDGALRLQPSSPYSCGVVVQTTRLDDVPWVIGFTHAGYADSDDVTDLADGINNSYTNRSILSNDGDGYSIDVLVARDGSDATGLVRLIRKDAYAITTLGDYEMTRPAADGDRFEMSGWWDGTTHHLTAWVNGEAVIEATDTNYAPSTFQITTNTTAHEAPAISAGMDPATWRGGIRAQWCYTDKPLTESGGGSGPDLSDATPQALGAAAAGVSTDASRADHVHALPSLSALGAAPAGIVERRTTDLSRNSTTTPAADTELVAAASASTTYELHALLIFSCSSDSIDANIGIDAPAGATIDVAVHGVNTPTTGTLGATRSGYLNSTSDVADMGVLSTVRASVLVVGIVQIAGTAGDVSIKWAQRSSSATDLTLKAGSTLRLIPLP